MLALKINKISPMFINGRLGREFTAVSCGTSHSYFLKQSYGTLPATNGILKDQIQATILAQNNFITQSAVNPFVLSATRFYSSEHHPPTSSSKPTRWPGKTNWPDKEQIEKYEKYFFRAIAFIMDITQWSYEWLMRNFDKHIMKHPTVQYYWKRFMEKIENSKK